MRCLKFLLAAVLLSACRPEPAPGPQAAAYRPRIDNPANARIVDSVAQILRSGDIALRTGSDMTSIMLRRMNQRDDSYSHCGIVLVENGYPFVYHSIGGEDNPDCHLRRDSAAVFFEPGENERLGVARLDLDTGQLRQLAAVARRHFEAGIPFDMDFDLGSDDRFYCAEFVCKSVQEAIGNRWNFAHSRALNREYVGVDNITHPDHARIICDVRYKL